MAAFDNVSLASPPNIATAGNYAQMLMQGLSAIPQDYYRGQEARYQQQQRNLFQNPDSSAMLQDAITTGNYTPLIQKLIQSGGAPTAASLIPSLMSQQAGSDIAKAINPGGVNTGPTASTAAASPASIGGQQPQPSADSGQSVRTLSAGIGGADRDIPGPAMDYIARGLGLPDANATIPPGLEQKTRDNISAYLSRVAGAGRQPIGSAATGGITPNRGGTNPVPQSGTGDDEGNPNHLPPSMGEGSSAITPPQSAASGRVSPSASGTVAGTPASFDQRFGAATGNPPGTRPTPVGTEAEARQAFEKAQRLRAIAARISGLNPKAGEQAGKAADYQEERGKQIMESLGKFNEPGRTQRDVESGATLTAERIKSDTERYAKQYDAYQHQADQAHQMIETNALTKSLMDQPSYYSGAGADHVLTMQRLAVALGLKPQDYAMANEVFGKTVSSAILDQIRSLGGQGLGQVRVAEINVMKQAAQNRDNTASSNRLLTELQDRLAQRWTIPIAEEAQKYNGGHLDAGFDRWKTQYINGHPLLSKEELADPRRIAPPLARTPADLKKIGWKDGDPFRTPDGRILTHLAQ